MAALSVIGSTLNRDILVPKNSHTGATSKGNPNAGASAPSNPAALRDNITTGDKAMLSVSYVNPSKTSFTATW